MPVLTQEVIKTSEIEGKLISLDAARLSIERRLELKINTLAASDLYVDGVVNVVVNTTRNFDQLLTKNRLFG